MNKNLYEDVTRRIIEEMEAGSLPWERPWTDATVIETARNALTGRAYSGINVLLLWNSACERGFATNRWMTFNQAQRSAGGVRKYERATRIVYVNRYLPRPERERIEAGLIAPHEAELRYHMRTYSVFNLDQVRDAPARLWPAPVEAAPDRRREAAEALARKNRARVRCFGNEAFYDHQRDFIGLPPVGRFPESDDWCATLLHELTHWTGHPSRLRRSFGHEVSDPAYIQEELVAELGAAYLSAGFGIRPRARHSDYLAYWLAVLRADSRALFRAASCATRATEFLLSGGGATRSSTDRAANGAASHDPVRERRPLSFRAAGPGAIRFTTEG